MIWVGKLNFSKGMVIMKDTKIYTCYGCPSYYAEEGEKYPAKHCGYDHAECPYYLCEGEPLIFNEY